MKFGTKTNKHQFAFTLAEVLAALLFMAVVIPVALEGMHVASRAAVDRACLERSVWRDSLANGWSPHQLVTAIGTTPTESRSSCSV